MPSVLLTVDHTVCTPYSVLRTPTILYLLHLYQRPRWDKGRLLVGYVACRAQTQRHGHPAPGTRRPAPSTQPACTTVVVSTSRISTLCKAVTLSRCHAVTLYLSRSRCTLMSPSRRESTAPLGPARLRFSTESYHWPGATRSQRALKPDGHYLRCLQDAAFSAFLDLFPVPKA